MLNFVTDRDELRGDMLELLGGFIKAEERNEFTVVFHSEITDKIRIEISINGKEFVFTTPLCASNDSIEKVRYESHAFKLALYKALSEYFSKQLPWGSLTGIRPTRLAFRMADEGCDTYEIEKRLQSEYFVSEPKAKLTAEIVKTQSKQVGDRMALLGDGTKRGICNLVNLYVHIPFCPTRCAYCSFVSEGIGKKKWLLAPYANALIEEIRITKELIASQGKRIFSVYIGGGTPTSLDCESLFKVLNAACEKGTEFTCEAGRPDTIDEEKAEIMQRCGVNRISINPQTLHEVTLKRIGREHTCEQFFEAYRTAEKFGFIKNVDLIAGFEGESSDDFRYTLDKIIDLSPENITVHTLCTKRGSDDALHGKEKNAFTEEMVDYSISALKTNGYSPYYLYRQKQMSGSLENIGWCKPNFLCVNNVTVMEETLPVYACGAGAISKNIGDGRIQRLANPKDVVMYLDQFDERMAKKKEFFTE